MVVTNQYSEIFRKIEIEEGVDLFKEYHREGITDEEREIIVKRIFDVFRSVNEVPANEWNDELIINSLRQLNRIKSNQLLNNGEWGLNPVGVDVLNHFFPNLNDVRKNNCPMTIREAFHNDKKLERAIRKTLKYKGDEMAVYRWIRMGGVGYCVNFRPAVARGIYELNAGPEARIYDFAGGYGSRCMGAYFAENVVEYVGVDVNTETVEYTHREQKFLTDNFGSSTKMTTYLCGSEEFLQNHPEYKGYFDMSFSSPQYFNTEIYSSEPTQSCHKYPDYVRWVKYFYIPTILNAIDVLKDGGIFAINIFEKLKNLKGDQNLKAVTKKIAASRGFICYKTEKMLLKTMPGKAGTDEEGNVIARDRTTGTNYEPIWYFRHYEHLFKDGIINEETYKEIDEKFKAGFYNIE